MIHPSNYPSTHPTIILLMYQLSYISPQGIDKLKTKLSKPLDFSSIVIPSNNPFNRLVPILLSPTPSILMTAVSDLFHQTPASEHVPIANMVCVCVCVSVYVFVCLCLCACVCLYLSVCLSVCLCLCDGLSISVIYNYIHSYKETIESFLVFIK